MTPLIIENFFPAVDAIRSDFERAVTFGHARLRERLVWDYYFSEGNFAYVRTTADRVITPSFHHLFVACLREFTLKELGCPRVFSPWMSYYLDGCFQARHTDTQPSFLSYVFSLTHWDQRSFRGGETFINDLSKGAETETVCYEPMFNRLLIFDGQLPHGVRRVRNVTDPRKARVVLHGLIPLPGICGVEGLLPGMEPRLRRQLADLERYINSLGTFSGVVVIRCKLAKGGLESCHLLVNTALDVRREEYSSTRLAELALAGVRNLDWGGLAEHATLSFPLQLGSAAG